MTQSRSGWANLRPRTYPRGERRRAGLYRHRHVARGGIASPEWGPIWRGMAPMDRVSASLIRDRCGDPDPGLRPSQLYAGGGEVADGDYTTR